MLYNYESEILYTQLQSIELLELQVIDRPPILFIILPTCKIKWPLMDMS